MSADMNKGQKKPPAREGEMRKTRLKTALRDNLKRRKAAPSQKKPPEPGQE